MISKYFAMVALWLCKKWQNQHSRQSAKDTLTEQRVCGYSDGQRVTTSKLSRTHTHTQTLAQTVGAH